jgi:hypothetical protein
MQYFSGKLKEGHQLQDLTVDGMQSETLQDTSQKRLSVVISWKSSTALPTAYVCMGLTQRPII